MAFNRLKRGSLQPQIDCHETCSDYLEMASQCQSGYYQCGSQPSICNDAMSFGCCTAIPMWGTDDNIGEAWGDGFDAWLMTDWSGGTGLPMCQYNCHCWQDYHQCQIDCGVSPRSTSTGTGTGRGPNFRRGGRMRKRFRTGGGTCPPGYRMGPNGVCIR